MKQYLKALGISSASTVMLCSAGVGHAQSIAGISVENTSSPDPNNTRRFLTKSQLGSVEVDELRVSFGHRMAFVNELDAFGGVAQVNKRNVVFDIAFTVEDPLLQGFVLRVDSVVHGVSEIDWQFGGSGQAFATGITLDARYDDSTDATGTFALIPSVFGQSTEGVVIDTPQIQNTEDFSEQVANLGPYTGTTDFVFRFTTLATPTTNVGLPNGADGSGGVYYGLGVLPDGFGALDPNDLGHFLTFTAAFASPCPADVNGDGAVDLGDLSMVLSNFGAVSLDGDATNDGVVDLVDLSAVLAAFGTSCN